MWNIWILDKKHRLKHLTFKYDFVLEPKWLTYASCTYRLSELNIWARDGRTDGRMANIWSLLVWTPVETKSWWIYREFTRLWLKGAKKLFCSWCKVNFFKCTFRTDGRNFFFIYVSHARKQEHAFRARMSTWH